MKLTKMRGKFLRRHGGTILAVVASVGVVATAIETGRATTKAKHLLEVDETLRKYVTEFWCGEYPNPELERLRAEYRVDRWSVKRFIYAAARRMMNDFD